MQIIVAEHIGFCFGVRRAIETAEREAETHGKVYTYGELIHNAAAVERLREKGVYTADSLEEIPEDILFAVLVEDFVAQLGIQLHGDILHAVVLEQAESLFHTAAETTHRIHGAGDEEDR